MGMKVSKNSCQKQIYYKVVCEKDGKLYSPFFSKDADIAVLYEVGKSSIAKIPNSKVFVCTNKDQAFGFAEACEKEKECKTKVFECEVELPCVLDLICNPHKENCLAAFTGFWNGAMDDGELILTSIGTKLASSVVLLKEIKKEVKILSKEETTKV